MKFCGTAKNVGNSNALYEFRHFGVNIEDAGSQKMLPVLELRMCDIGHFIFENDGKLVPLVNYDAMMIAKFDPKYPCYRVLMITNYWVTVL